jgi:addiction module RelE/StbE family toxin
MIPIKTTKSFDKQYAKLNLKIKDQFKDRLKLFIDDPFNPRLRNHPLKGNFLGYRSIDVSGDVRVLYTVKGERSLYLVLSELIVSCID